MGTLTPQVLCFGQFKILIGKEFVIAIGCQ